MGHKPNYDHRKVAVDKTFEARARELVCQYSIDHIAKRIADANRNVDPKQFLEIEHTDHRQQKRIPHDAKKEIVFSF
jgi:hypothetical protein